MFILYENHSKGSKLHPERGAIAEHFCCSNAPPLFIKLEKLIMIFVLISVQVRPVQNWEMRNKSKNWLKRRSF